MKRILLILANCVALIIYAGLAIYAGILLAGCTPSAPTTQSPSTGSKPPAGPSWQQQVSDLVNAERVKAKLPALRFTDRLLGSSQVYAHDMAVAGQLTHTLNGEPFGQRLSREGIVYRAAGENIALGYNSPQAVVAGWMGSSGHRANILNATYTQTGVGYYMASSQRGCYWCQQFIQPTTGSLGTPHDPPLCLPDPLFRLDLLNPVTE